jgi:hypothetical protein
MMSRLFLATCLIVVASGCDTPEVSDARIATPPPTGATAATSEATNMPATESSPVPPPTGTTTATPAPAEQSAAETAAPTTAPAAESTSAPVGEAGAEGENPYESWWQLADDSELTAKFERTPPRLGLNRLMVELTTDDFEQKFDGTIEYRTSLTEQSDEPWRELVQVHEDENATYYLAEIVIPPKGAYVQFHIKDVSDEEFYDLTDWQVKVPLKGTK